MGSDPNVPYRVLKKEKDYPVEIRQYDEFIVAKTEKSNKTSVKSDTKLFLPIMGYLY